MTALPARIDYICANERVLSVARSADLRTARVALNDDVLQLVRSGTGAQEKYTDTQYTLYLQGERAMLELNGQVLFGPCVSPVPLPTVYQTNPVYH